MDIKVLVYYNFSKKMKSPSSMSIGRFHPLKYRSKVQKKKVLYNQFSKMLGPFLIAPKKIKFKNKKIGKNGGAAYSLSDYRPRSTSNRWPGGQGCQTAGRRQQSTNRSQLVTNSRPQALRRCLKFLLCKILFFFLYIFFLHLWSTLAGWL
jgi:hypothetical protein